MEGVETLSMNDCLGLIAGRSLGRVAYTERALPAIWPVRYALVGSHLVLCTHHDGLAERLDGQIVAFEIDDADAEGEYAWIVVVTGTASNLPEPSELHGQGDVPLAPRAGPGNVTAVRITPGDVRGCRILRTPVTAV